MNNKFLMWVAIVWAACLVTLGIVAEIAHGDIQKQKSNLSLGKGDVPIENR